MNPLNRGATTATASSEPIMKADQLIAIFKRKIAVVSLNHEGNAHRLGDSSQLPLYQ